MDSIIQFAVNSLRKTSIKAAATLPDYTVKQVADANGKHRFVFETTVSWDKGAAVLTVAAPGKVRSKRKAAFAMLQKLRADGVEIIDGASREAAPSVVSAASSCDSLQNHVPDNNNNNSSSAVLVKPTSAASAAPSNENIDDNADSPPSEECKNSKISFNNTLSPMRSLDPAATQAKSKPFMSQKRTKFNFNPFGNTKENANIHTTCTVTSNPFVKAATLGNPFAAKALPGSPNSSPFAGSTPAAGTTTTTKTTPKMASSPFGKTAATAPTSNPCAMETSTTTAAKKPNPFAPQSTASPKVIASAVPLQDTTGTASAASTSMASNPFLLNQDTSKVSYPETIDLKHSNSSSVPKNPFLSKDVPISTGTDSASSATAASNSMGAFDSNTLGAVSASSPSSIPANPFVKRPNGINVAKPAMTTSCTADSNKVAALSASSPSSTPANPFAKRANGTNAAEKEPSTSVPPNPFLKASKGVKFANGATVSSSAIPIGSNGVKKSALHDSPNGGSGNGTNNNNATAASSQSVAAKAPKKGLNPTAAAWKPNPRAAAFVPKTQQTPAVIMEKKKNEDTHRPARNAGAHNSPYLHGYAPPLFSHSPPPLPIVNEPRNVSAPFDPRIPNALYFPPTALSLSPPPPSVNNPSPMGPSWNPFSGVGNVFNPSPILPNPTPASRSTSPPPPSSDLVQYPSAPSPSPSPVFCTSNPIGSAVRNNENNNNSHDSSAPRVDQSNAARSTANKAVAIIAPSAEKAAINLAHAPAPPAPPAQEAQLDTKKKAINPFMASDNNITLSFTNPFTASKRAAPETKANTPTSIPAKHYARGNPFVKGSELTAPKLKLDNSGANTEANNARKHKRNEVMRDSRGTRAFDLSFARPSPGAPPHNSPYFNNGSNSNSPIAETSPQSHYQLQPQLQTMKTEGSTAPGIGNGNVNSKPAMAATGTKKKKTSPAPSVGPSGKASKNATKKNPFAKPNTSYKRSAPSVNAASTRNSASQNKTDSATTTGAAGTGTKNSNPFAAAANSVRKKSKNVRNGAETRPAEGNGNWKPNRALSTANPFQPAYGKNGNLPNGNTVSRDTPTAAQNGPVLDPAKKKKVATAVSNDANASTKKSVPVSAAAAAKAGKKPYALNPNAASFRNWTPPGETPELPDALQPSDIRRVEPEVFPAAKPQTSKPYVKPPSQALPIVKPPSCDEPIVWPAKAAASGGDCKTVEKSQIKSQLVTTYTVAVDKNPAGASAAATVVDTGSVNINGVQKRMIVAPRTSGVAVAEQGEENKKCTPGRATVPGKPGPPARIAKEKAKAKPKPTVNASAVTAPSPSPKAKPFAVAPTAQKAKSSTPAAQKMKSTPPLETSKKSSTPVVTSTKPTAPLMVSKTASTPAVTAAKSTAPLVTSSEHTSPAVTSVKHVAAIERTSGPVSSPVTGAVAPRCHGGRPTKLWIFCNGQEANIRKTLLDLEIPANGHIETCFNLVNNTHITRNALHCKIAAKAAVKAYALKNIEADAESEPMDHKVLIVSTMNMKSHFGEDLGNVELVEAKHLGQYVASLNK